MLFAIGSQNAFANCKDAQASCDVFLCFLLVWLQNTNFIVLPTKSWLGSPLLPVPLSPLNPIGDKGKIEDMTINIPLGPRVQ